MKPGHIDTVQVIRADGTIGTTKLMTVGVVKQPEIPATDPPAVPVVEPAAVNESAPAPDVALEAASDLPAGGAAGLL